MFLIASFYDALASMHVKNRPIIIRAVTPTSR
jgi:hypothetical protein